MQTGKFNLVYDKDYDNLFIYSPVKRSSYGIEWGGLDISFDKKGELANLSINNASGILSNLTNTKVTPQELKKINNCRLNIKNQQGVVFISFKLFFKDKSKSPIVDTITVKAPKYKSPIVTLA